jgi:hypothetical protein
VVDSVPGRIRVQLGERHSSGLISILGLGGKPTVRRPLIDLEMHMEKREAGNASKLHITVVYKPPGGRTQAMMPGWREKCNQVHRELQAYLMGRG